MNMYENPIRRKNYTGFFVMLALFILSISLSILPIPLWMVNLWPLWSILILIFLVAYLPDVIPLWLIWLMGLLYDVMQGSLLGEHALGFIGVYFLTSRTSQQIKSFPLLTQMIKIAFILINYQLVILFCQGFAIRDLFLSFLPIITSLILWPWILFLMRKIALPFYIHQM